MQTFYQLMIDIHPHAIYSLHRIDSEDIAVIDHATQEGVAAAIIEEMERNFSKAGEEEKPVPQKSQPLDAQVV